MKILHLSTECYPAAKTGGLGDVVGALPKYQKRTGHEAHVIIPKYGIPWIKASENETIFEENISLGIESHYFSIDQYKGDLGYDLLFANIPSLFDRNGIYADQYGFFGDEFKRWIAFIKSVLNWMITAEVHYDILHCHDHHTGLVPFFIRYCPEYSTLKKIPTVFTIHNGKYQGVNSWKEFHYLPYFPSEFGGLIEWNNHINLMSAGVRNCWKLTTVSNNYLNELKYDSDGLEWLFQNESNKSIGILNGIDTEQWDPSTDERIGYVLKKSIPQFKKNNKNALLEQIKSKNEGPIVAFIGRLVYEKGIDFLIDLLQNYLTYYPKTLHFVLLGTGDQSFESGLYFLHKQFPEDITLILKYDESLAHQIYAGADYLIMPSRVEPCGLNQFYALRYGTIPIVRRIGGLADSITDIGDPDGNGICFDNLSIHDGMHALNRVSALYQNKKYFNQIRKNIMLEDNSWDASSEKYLAIYESLTV